jgi:hypothetical protein
MADKKISALTASTTPLAGTEVLPIVQSGATVKVSVANLTAGRNVSGLAYTGFSPDGTKQLVITPGDAGHQILGDYSTGSNVPIQIGIYTIPAMLKFETTGDVTVKNNLVIGTSGKGIDFSATPGTGTSELLADYEEGDWTPVPTSGSGSITSYTSSGRYTKTGRIVVLVAEITITNGGTASGLMTISGLPFTSFSGQAQPGIAYDPNITGTSVCVFVNSGATTATVRQFAGTAPLYTNGIAYQFVVTYQV